MVENTNAITRIVATMEAEKEVKVLRRASFTLIKDRHHEYRLL